MGACVKHRPMISFESGPRLNEPRGDTATQAVAALRGYGYQLYASGLAWLNLSDGEVLHLEIAEDYAVVTDAALKGTQVRDTAGSGSITLQSSNVRKALNAFVDLIERNPGRTVFFHYLTTSEIGTERSKDQRVGDEPALLYWRRAAAGAEIAPLRSLLLELELKPKTLSHIAGLDNEALRRDFLSRIHWECGAPNILGVRSDLEAGMIEYVATARRLSSSVGKALVPSVVEKVLMTATNRENRALRRADLLSLIDQAALVSVPLEHLTTGLSDSISGGGYTKSSILNPVNDLPLPSIMTSRARLVDRIDRARRATGVAFICGATGLGKSFAARLLANQDQLAWDIVDFRDLTAKETEARLQVLIGEFAARPAKNLILDDFNEADAPAVRDLMARFIALARRRDVTIVLTAYVAPKASTFHRFGCAASSIVEVPYFEEIEVEELVELAGGDRKYAGSVFRVASHGHPQLTLAAVVYLLSMGWSRKALSEILTEQIFEEIDAERDAVRLRLLLAMPPDGQHLLFRASMIRGSFDRELGIALGEIQPPLTFPGAVLDRLIGPWIEVVHRSRFRVSPLLIGAADKVFGASDRKAIHSFIATSLLERDSLSVLDSGLLMHHALGSREPSLIIGFANGVITSGTDTLDLIAPFIADIAKLDMTKPICAGEPAVSAMMRLAQLLAFLPSGSPDEAQTCFMALERERVEVDHKGNLELTILSKLLLYPRAGELFPNWFDLLVRTDDLMMEGGFLSEPFGKASSDADGLPDLCGILFACQMRNIETVAEFHQLVSRLDKEPSARRVRFLSSFRPGRGDISILVNHGWMKEGRDPGFDWEAAAQLYADSAKIAFSWQDRVFASRCAVAQAICYDENGRDPDRALRSLEDAERSFGFDIAIVRAKAKVLWRRNDHAAALPLLTAAAEQGEHDQVEYAYIAREAGISAAELAQWADAENWFEGAQTAATGIDLPVVKSMSVGLIADSAHAAYMAGRPHFAVEKLKFALQQVQQLDPDGSLPEAYCHRVIRHAVLWLFDQLTGRIRDFQDTSYAPGCASNPEPPEAIRLHPLGDIDLAFYLLADADEALNQPTGFYREYRNYLARGPILNYEASRNISEDNRAIREHDVLNFVWRLRRHAALDYFVATHPPGSEKEDLRDPIRGRIEPVDLVMAPPHLTKGAEDYLITFVFAMIIAGDRRAADAAIEAALQASAISDLHPLLDRMNGASETVPRSDREGAASTIYLLRKEQAPDPLAFWWAGVWMLIHLRASNLRRCLADAVIDWIFKGWEQRALTQRFRLNAPHINIPPIEACLIQNDRTLTGVTRLVLAAAPAVGAQIDAVHDALTELL